MKVRKFTRIGIITFTLICALVMFFFTTCDVEGAKVEVVDAAIPVFDDEPLGKSIEPGDTVHLVAVATAPDNGFITYQWFSLAAEYDEPVGEAITEKDEWSSSIDVPLVDEGIYLYYVEVTNTNNKVNGKKTATLTSNLIVVTVESADASVKYPVIKQQPANNKVMVGNTDLKIEAANAEGDTGVLSYQWFSVNGTGNKDGVVINGATSSTSTINISAPGEYNYYCVVTNTVGNLSKSITSQTATITTIAELVPNATIVVNPNRKYQYVRGFGGMGANTFQKDTNQKIKTEAEFEKMFGNGDNQLGLNMLRIMIGNDFETDIYQEFLANGGDPTDPGAVHDYYQQKDEPMYYEGVKIVNKYGGYVLASPWTGPAQWKSNNSKNGGGHLLPNYYGAYAKYLRDYCQHMYDKGAPIYVVSIQNEPNFTATYDGCEWSPEEMRDFFVQQGHFTTVGGAIPGYGGGKATDYVLTMNGESANNPSINNAAMANPTARAAIDVLGRHTYGDALFRYSEALDKEPKREVWMTEHNINSGNADAYPNDSTWNYVWLFLNDLDLSIRQNDESAFIWWYLKRFYCIIGDGTYGTSEGVIYPRGYALSHYAKYAKETWRMGVNVTGATANGDPINTGNVNPSALSRTTTHVRVTGFVSPDGNTISLVMYTPTDTSGGRGVDMGTVKIQLPQGFIVSKADAMRSNATAKIKKESVLLSADKNSALVMLPPSTILSVRFTKE